MGVISGDGDRTGGNVLYIIGQRGARARRRTTIRAAILMAGDETPVSCDLIIHSSSLRQQIPQFHMQFPEEISIAGLVREIRQPTDV